MALNKELVIFLKWLKKRPIPVSQQTMDQCSAPEYSPSRIKYLYSKGYIERAYVCENGEMVAGYSVSDKGRQELQAKSSDNRRWWALFVCQLCSTAIAVAAFIKSFFF